MRRLLMIVATLAMTTLFAQANDQADDMANRKAAVEKLMQEATPVSSEAEEKTAPKSEDDKNATDKQTPEMK